MQYELYMYPRVSKHFPEKANKLQVTTTKVTNIGCALCTMLTHQHERFIVLNLGLIFSHRGCFQGFEPVT